MPYLMHIGFDNNCKLLRRVHYFSYKGIRYKLIQNNPRKWKSVLLTIIDDYKNEEAQDRVFEAAGEFISALAWENGSKMRLSDIGGRCIKNGYTLRKARCNHFTFPSIPFEGVGISGGISRLPYVENERQKKA